MSKINFNPSGKNDITEVKIFIGKDKELKCFNCLRKDDFNWCLHHVLSQGMFLQNIGMYAEDFLRYDDRISTLYNELSSEDDYYIIENIFKNLKSQLQYNPYLDFYFIRKDIIC